MNLELQLKTALNGNRSLKEVQELCFRGADDPADINRYGNPTRVNQAGDILLRT